MTGYPATPPREGVELKDRGSQLHIVAGKISLEWSFNTHDAGWVHYSPERERIFFIDGKSFADLDLSRFSKPQRK
jgi:hypothetical protein